MKATAEGGWCHLLCATWIPGMCVADQTRMEPIVGVNKVGKDRRSLVCSICGQQYGACIQCAGSSKCYAAFHATCARDAGYPMAAVYDEDSSDDDEQPPETVGQAAAAAAAAAATAAAAAGPVAAPARLSSSSMGEGAGAAPDAPGAAAGPAAAKSRRKGRPKKARKEGTAAGDNTRLFCFCPRHRHVAAGVADSLIHQTTVGGPSPSLQLLAGQSSALLAGSAAGNSAAGSAGGSAGAGCHQEVTSPHRQPDRQAAGGAAAWPGLAAAAAGGVTLFGDATAAAGSCARSRPADTAVRRGMRAPDALAAALRKRLYVRALPYRVTSCTCAGQLLPPPIKRGRVTGPEFHSTCPQQQAGGCNGVSSSGSSPPAACATATHRPAVGAGVAAGIGACAAAGVAASLCPGRRQSQLERYRQMVASTAERVSSGKSAIHGLGVFANVAHSAGDYVVEYMGHLVRPLVADRLEAHTYNQLVGAGTYIFRLNADFNVDATRAGNIAHLINHSCAPCCHSRTITLACPDTGEQQDHVVIVASRDIAVGEELTYDYRFAGDEKLRCNCGAPACRGWVNAPFSCESPQAGVLRLPKRDLMPLPPGAGTDTTAAASSLRPQRLMLGS